MERRLVVMRHAKSSWKSPAETDHQRPLNQRGQRSAPMIAAELSQRDWVPQQILSSDATRTRETAQLMLGEWEDGIQTEFVSNLYLAGPEELKYELCAISDEVEVLLVLGHNPGWESVVHRLTDVPVTMKTASTALLKSSHCESWSDAFDAAWELEDIINPRELLA